MPALAIIAFAFSAQAPWLLYATAVVWGGIGGALQWGGAVGLAAWLAVLSVVVLLASQKTQISSKIGLSP